MVDLPPLTPWSSVCGVNIGIRVARVGARPPAEPSPRPCERNVMKAVSIKEPGGPEVLQWVDAEDPAPAAGEVVVDVVASAVNRADVMQRMGLYPVPEGASPYPGLEVSGRISAVGEGVTGWKVGDEVCALLTGGGYAQKVAVPAGQLLTVPKGIGLVEAAGLPEAVATVWSNLVMTANLKEGRPFSSMAARAASAPRPSRSPRRSGPGSSPPSAVRRRPPGQRSWAPTLR